MYESRVQIALNTELRSYCDTIRQIDHDVRALVVELSPNQLGWHPTSAAWSIAQCLDHLAVTNGKLMPRIEQAIQQLRERGWRSDGPFRYNWGERRFVALLAPGAAPWLRAPGIYRPTSQPDGAEAIKRFMTLEERLLTCLEQANGYDIGRIKVASPMSSLLRLRLGAWFAATVNHNRNHLQQAQRVRSAATFPSA